MQAHNEILRLYYRRELPGRLNANDIRKEAEKVTSIVWVAGFVVIITLLFTLITLFSPQFPHANAAAGIILATGLACAVILVSVNPFLSSAQQKCREWLADYEMLLKNLNLRPDVFVKMLLEEQKAAANAKLQEYGDELVAKEEQYRPNSLAPEVVTYRRRFEDQYALSLRMGLIEDVGYGHYFKRAA